MAVPFDFPELGFAEAAAVAAAKQRDISAHVEKLIAKTREDV